MSKYPTIRTAFGSGSIALGALVFFLGGSVASANHMHGRCYKDCNAQKSGLDYPKYKALRFEEDWSPMEHLPDRNFLDYMKQGHYLGEEDVTLSVGGQLRERMEVWDNFNFGTPTRDNDTFLLHRLQLHGDVHVGEHFRAFGEVLNALSSNRMLPGKRRTSDVDTIAILNAFLEWKQELPFLDMTATARVGRQQFAFGNQRLVSLLPWANTYRRWDGVSLIFEQDCWKAHLFGAFYAPVKKYEFDDADNDEVFYGIYGNYADMVDLYFLVRDADTSTRTAFRDERYTMGFRVYGDFLDKELTYEFEAAYQLGEAARLGGAGVPGAAGYVSVSAYMIAAKLGYVLNEYSMKPGVWLGLDVASGNRDTGAAFMPDYPLGHSYFGYIDAVGRRNIIDFSQGIYFSPCPCIKVELANHIFWRQNDSDGLYSAGNALTRAGTATTSRYIGDEVDLTFKYQVNQNINLLLGASHFFTGDFIKDTGTNKDVNFGYAQIQVLF